MKTYEEYKSSEIEWIGEIPTDWDVKKIKWMTSIKRGASPRPIDDPKYFDEDGEYAWVRIADVSNAGMYLEQTTQKMSELGASLSVKREPGDIFVSIAGTVGKPCITNIKCCIHDGFVYFPDYKGDKKYFYYIFESGAPYKGLGKMGTQLNLNTETIGSIKIPDIPSNLQTKIGLFIDGKVHEIDTLLDLKQKQIEKLEQQRQSIITEAVTKGLNPNVKMKDSGVEWIGEIPEHWEIKKVKHALNNLDYRRIPLSSEERGKMSEKTYDYYGASGVIDKVDNYLFDETLILIGEDGANLFSRSTPLAFLAKGKYWVNNHAHILKPKIGSIDYFVNLLESIDYSIYISGSAQPKLTQEALGNISILLPPIEEQFVIGDFVNDVLNEHSKVISMLNIQIEKLKEYRQSLIYEAVTGKIDVRDMELD